MTDHEPHSKKKKPKKKKQKRAKPVDAGSGYDEYDSPTRCHCEECM